VLREGFRSLASNRALRFSLSLLQAIEFNPDSLYNEHGEYSLQIAMSLAKGDTL
jgi:hypothetical protein